MLDDPTALAVYAGQLQTRVTILASLAGICFGGLTWFAFLFGTVAPRLRRAHRRQRALRAERRALQMVVRGLKADLVVGAARIAELEATCAAFEKELRRVDAIRQRTDQHFTAFRRRYELLEHENLQLRRGAIDTEPGVMQP